MHGVVAHQVPKCSRFFAAGTHGCSTSPITNRLIKGMIARRFPECISRWIVGVRLEDEVVTTECGEFFDVAAHLAISPGRSAHQAPVTATDPRTVRSL